jgi:pectin methylesterase-like acyl-CoA thioesterase
MKASSLFGLISMLATPLVAIGQTVIFNDTFNGNSTLNGTSTPGGTPSASYTSYDVASTKTGSCSTNANFLRVKLSSGTTAGYLELQAMFVSTPVHLVNVGDSINLTFPFTNSAGTLLAGGSGSVIDVGLFNSGGNAPLAGSLNGAGLSGSTTYALGNCQNWQGYVASINYNGASSSVYTRPVQTGTTSANQDLLFSGAGTGLFTNPKGTQIGSTITSGVTLISGAKYTLSFTALLSAAQTVTIINNLYDSSGTLISAQTNATTGGNTYTNYSNYYDGLAIGLANKGTSLNPTMDISRITISTNYYYAPAVAGLTNQTVIAGKNATLSLTVAGNPTPAFQWYVSTDGGATSNAIAGATGATLTLPNVQYSQNNYQYSVVATNSLGTNAAAMTLSVIVTPSITGLLNQAVYPNSTVIMSLTVSGVPAPTLQWQLNGINLVDGATVNGSTIAGSTSSTLAITNAAVADSGTYSLVASNSAGIVTNSMSLLVSETNVLPVITGPANITVVQGSSGTFSATVLGLPVPTLQWLDQTQTPIGGATNANLTLNNVQYSQNGYSYYLVASNSEGSVTNSATLTVLVPPAITSQPVSLVVTNTQSASFTVGATGVPAIAYQWQKNNSSISTAANSTATNATLVIASASPSDMATYSCSITNLVGTTNTVSVSLTVNSLMSATALSPTNGAAVICYDTPLYITFGQTPTLRTNGTIKIYNVTNSTTSVDTINLALSTMNSAAGLSNIQAHSVFPGDGQIFSYYPIVISGTTAAIYPHGGVMTSNQTYYVTIDDGAFADAAGAYFAGITATNTWQFTTKPTGPADPVNPVVNADGSADFVTVQGAVDSLALDAGGARRTINVKNGTYFELVDISGKTNVTLRGQSRTGTIIKYPNNANLQIAQSGTTHARMSFKVNANDVAIENLFLTNSTPQGGSQAEALMIESAAKRCIINNCEIDSRQDTILANVNSSQAYFYNTTIKGNFDFIWGGGNLYFDKCVLRTISGASGFNLTAARTDTSTSLSTNTPWVNPNGTTYSANGISFVNCTLSADAGVTNISLAGNNGTAGGLDSWAFCVIDTNAYTGAASLSNNYVFWQYQNTDTNGNPVTMAGLQTLTNGDPRLLAATNVTTWFYGWTPQLAPNILTNPANQSVAGGGTISLAVAVTGIPAPAYQWLKNGTPLDGQTNATLTIANAHAGQAGTYSVIVSNVAAVVTSDHATVTIGNTAPTLGVIVDQTVNVGVTVSINVAALAADPDVPPQALTFSLTSGPTNATIDPGTGAFSFRPLVSQAGATYPITLSVADNGAGNLSVSRSFSVIVNSLTQPDISSTVWASGKFSLSVSGQSGPDYAVQASTNLVDWQSVFTTNSPAFEWTDPNTGTFPMRFYRIVVGPPLP